MVAPIFGSTRNITCEQYFTSVALFEEFLQSRLTAVGTVMTNCKHLPPQLLPCTEKRDLDSSMFTYKEKVNMVSWHRKKSKFVLLLSTLHHDSSLEPDGNLEIVSYYIIRQRQELMPLTKMFGIILLIEKQTDDLWQWCITLLILHHTMLMLCSKSNHPSS